MPPEWARHASTWLEFPTPGPTFGAEGSLTLRTAHAAWAGVANSLAEYEPVTVLVPDEHRESARRLLAPAVRLHHAVTGSPWLRDSGPTFVHTADRVPAMINWSRRAGGDRRDRPARSPLAEAAGVASLDSPLPPVGAGVHVDGDGTVLLTATGPLAPERNPGWTRQRIEAELHARLGTSKAIWLPTELTAASPWAADRGRVDMLAAFVRPGVVVVHEQPDPTQPDYLVSRRVLELLRSSTDARGRRLVVIPLPAPSARRADGHPARYSYINHYVANGVVLLGVFDDPNDVLAGQILRRLYRRRAVVLFDARDFFALGGGIHSATLQQPDRSAAPGAWISR
jgi:agmatine deiminase